MESSLESTISSIPVIPRTAPVYGLTHHHSGGELRRNNAKPFVGVDGEGGNIPHPNMLPGFGTLHAYLLLRAGGEVLETGKPLSFYECCDFLCSLRSDRLYVGYFFDYDTNMILSQLPKERYARIYHRHLRSNPGASGWPLPVDVPPFQVDYLPHKEFRVRRAGTTNWTIVSDVGQFFQTGFLATLERWDIGTPEERALIARGKAERINFGEMTDETRFYNQLECKLLEILMESFRRVCREVGYLPAKYQGPGYLASAMLTRHGIPKRDSIPILTNERFKGLANDAYYGGRFETTAAGPISGPIYQYDINSAYPFALKSLPCLLHGTWRQTKTRPDKGLWFGKVYFTHSGFRYLHNLPVRTKNGNIFYPREGNGVYWSTEIESAERNGTESTFSGGWLYESDCQCEPFSFIDAYYRQRIRLGKGTRGYVLKLAGNSLYGKISQSIGYAPFANPVWAGLITAKCRSMIVDAYSQAPEQCYMIATDGIFMGEQLVLRRGNGLGEWDETCHQDGMFIIQPGLYFIGDSAKTRGIERGRIYDMRSNFEDAWIRFRASHGEHHVVSVEVDNFITCSQALSRNRWEIAGTWEHTTRDVSFDWSIKRKRIIARFEDRGCRTLPHDGSSNLVSVPYPRVIGGNLRESPSDRYTEPALKLKEDMLDQPDWGQRLL